ncbi:hypothetical protein [Nakamurella deserti]|uniref:hypothetical protein n=1 Tax=Nakamurella deserti TaxID=2164074 RepID=UPI0013009B5E|nr:hypothetical protein [Nakamurella deserti]
MSAAVPQPDDPPVSVVPVNTGEPMEKCGRSTFGVITFALAVLVFLVEPALAGLVNTERFLGQASTISGTVMGIQLPAVLVVLALAITAAVRRRGTSWAVAAIAVSLVGNSLFLAGVRYLFQLVFTGIYGTPTVGY